MAGRMRMVEDGRRLGLEPPDGLKELGLFRGEISATRA
jgi:hypothetical protein